MAIDANMNFAEYSGVKPFRFWCQKVLPLVYDDSLSYYELLCKVVNYINNLIADDVAMQNNIDELSDDVSELNESFVALQQYVDNYFENLDIQDEIDNKLDEMAENGELGTALSQYSKLPVTPYMFGAKGDGVTDDKEALQACCDSGQPVLISDGVFAVTITTAYGNGITVKSNNHITFDNATIKLLPTNQNAYQIIGIGEGVDNVVIDGNGIVIGDRDGHLTETGEWGMGVNIYQCNNIKVSGLTVTDCWGDGFYLSGANDVTVKDCVSDGNRRNAFTVISGENYLIDNCEAKNTSGTNPQAGFSFESNTTLDGMNNVVLRNCWSHDNTGSPLYITCRADANSVTVQGGEFNGVRPSTTFLTGGGIVRYCDCIMKVGTSELFDVGIVPAGSLVVYDNVTFVGGSSIIRHDGGSGSVLKGLIVKNCVVLNANLSRLGTWLRYGNGSVEGNYLELTFVNPTITSLASHVFLDHYNTAIIKCSKSYESTGVNVGSVPFNNILVNPANNGDYPFKITDGFGFNENSDTYITNIHDSNRAYISSTGQDFYFSGGSHQNYVQVDAGQTLKISNINGKYYATTL